jgi:hypothetical protein
LRVLACPTHLSNMSLRHTLTLTLSLLVAGTAVAVEDVSAQPVPGAQSQATSGWAPPSFGIRFGWDNQQQSQMLGAQLRLPIVPGGQIELMPSMDISFLRGLKEYQYNFEGVYVLDGRAGGLYGGGGIGLRNSIFTDGQGRRTERGYTAVVGLRLVDLGVVVPQIEYRWVFISDAPVTYQQLSLGLNLALWRPVARR